MLLTKHEKVTFKNQTVYISGQAFLNCSFIDCTLILRETIYFSRTAPSSDATGTWTGF